MSDPVRTLRAPQVPPPAHPVLSENGALEARWYGLMMALARQIHGLPVVTVDEAFTVGSEPVVICDASGGDFTVTLPEAEKATGYRYVFKKIDASVNAVTIDGYGAETVDGAATKSLSAQYETLTVVCDGTEWFTI